MKKTNGQYVAEKKEMDAFSENKKILIVEDDTSSALLIKEILSPMGYQTYLVGDGTEAIEFIRTKGADLVLMDLKLPTMSGYEAISEIRKFNISIPIIAQTANAIMGERKKAISAGCSDYISKPIDADQLIDLVSRYINK